MRGIVGIAAVVAALFTSRVGRCVDIDPTEGDLMCLQAALSGMLSPTPQNAAKAIVDCLTPDTTVEDEHEHLRQVLKKMGTKRAQKMLCESHTNEDERGRLEAALSASLQRLQKRQSLPGTNGQSRGSAPPPSVDGDAPALPVCDLPSGTCTIVITAEEGYVNRKLKCVNTRGEVVENVNNEKWAIEEDEPRPGSPGYETPEPRPWPYPPNEPMPWPGPGGRYWIEYEETWEY